jgi:hypothetical protein
MLHHGVLKQVIKHKSIFWLNADAATVTELTRDPITRLMALFEPKFVVDLLHDLKASNADINKANLLENWYQSKAKPRELLVLGHSRYLVKEFCILKEYDEFELAVIESWDPPVFPISGGDILACGVPQGPKIGEWLRYLYKQWCDTNYALSRDELLNRIK